MDLSHLLFVVRYGRVTPFICGGIKGRQNLKPQKMLKLLKISCNTWYLHHFGIRITTSVSLSVT